MKTKILSKSLSLALSLVILVSMFSICLFSASALDAEFLLDDETNGFANWNNSLNVDGTLKDGMVKKFLTVNEEKWPSGKIIDTASLGFTATTVQGANSNSISFVYYYENENNYKIFSARETAAGLLYVSLSDMVEGELSTPTEITSDQSKILSSSLGARSAGVYLGMNAGVTCVISYLDKDNVNIIRKTILSTPFHRFAAVKVLPLMPSDSSRTAVFSFWRCDVALFFKNGKGLR